MLFSCFLSFAAALFLAVYGDESVLWLKIASGVLGFGTAAIYATGLLWLEQYMKITNRIGAFMSVAACIGSNVFPLMMGQLVEDVPMIIMYLTFATIAVCSINFVIALFVGWKLSTKLAKADPE